MGLREQRLIIALRQKFQGEAAGGSKLIEQTLHTFRDFRDLERYT